jgi:N-acetylglucosamine-6-sulfatase
VPLVVRGPGVPAGVVRDQLVINNDFAPTFADWAGTSVPGFVDGRSLAPLLRPNPPPDSEWRTAILNEQSQKQRFHIPDYEAVRTRPRPTCGGRPGSGSSTTCRATRTS